MSCHFFSQKNRFHVAQTLTYRNGYALPSRPAFAVGGEPLPHNQVTEEELDELAKTRPTMTYGQPKEPAPKEFVPAHVAFDKKVLLPACTHSTAVWGRAGHAGCDTCVFQHTTALSLCYYITMSIDVCAYMLACIVSMNACVHTYVYIRMYVHTS